jgi:hypothetical protein
MLLEMLLLDNKMPHLPKMNHVIFYDQLLTLKNKQFSGRFTQFSVSFEKKYR